MRAVLDSAVVVARDVSTSNTLRIEAVDLLAYHAAAAEALLSLALDDSAQDVRLRAIAALNQQTASEPWRTLFGKLPNQSPSVRRAIVDAALARPDRTALLLDEIVAGRLKVTELDRTQTSRLLEHRDSTIRQRATQLLADAVAPDRQQALADYQSSLQLDADARRGLAIFRKNCATCHRIGEVGVNVAPDIADSRTKTPGQLLTDILQPNRAIDSNYLSYTVATFDGRVLTGILVAETANSITLQQPEAQSLTLLRSDIEELRSSGLSLMPEGLEKNLSLQDMADLISFIKNWRYLNGSTPILGNR
jgi:putative heme-binding domain-containing protein